MRAWSGSLFALLLGQLSALSLFRAEQVWAEPTASPPTASSSAGSASAAAPQTEEAQVTVKGARSHRDESEPELSSTVIRGDALRVPGVDATEVLSRTPGVQVKRTGSSADVSTISLRGGPASQVPVYLAGVRLNDDIVGVADLSRVPLSLMERVTVYRSAVPLTLGRSGLSGAVLFEPTLPEKNEVRASALAGSFGTGAVQVGLTGAYDTGEPARGATTVAYRRASAKNNFTYDDDQGTGFDTADDARTERENADSTEGDLWVISRHALGTRQGPASVTLFYNWFQREQGVTGLSLTPAESARAALSRHLLGLGSRLPCSLGEACSLQLTTGASSTALTTTDSLGELSLGAQEVQQTGARVTEQATLEVSFSPRVTGGVSGIYEGNRIELDGLSSSGLVSELVSAKESYLGGVLTLEVLPIKELILRGAGRVSCVLMDGREATASGEAAGLNTYDQCLPEGRLGASLTLGSYWTVRATAVRGLRFVTLGERYGVSASTRGNPELAPERGYSGDLGAIFSMPLGPFTELELDSAAYARSTQDLVAYQRSSLGYVRPYNVGSARMLGFETTLSLDLLRHLRLGSGLSLLDARDVTDGAPTEGQLVPFQSPVTFTQEFEVYDETVRGLLRRQALNLSFNYRSFRVADPAGLILIPAQWTLDAAYGISLTDAVLVQMRGENLADASQFDTLGFPLPGRAFFVSAEYALR